MYNLKVNLSFIISVISFVGVVTIYFKKDESVNSKIVFVDVNSLMQNYKGIIAAKKEYQDRTKAMNDKVDSLFTDWQNNLAEYERKKGNMSEVDKQTKMELIKNKESKIGLIQQNNKKQAEKIFDETVAEIYKVVKTFVADYGKQHNYNYILGATVSENILYGNRPLDITQDILKALNEKFK